MLVTEDESTKSIIDAIGDIMDVATQHLPEEFRFVLDFGCGTGRRSLALAKRVRADRLLMVDQQRQLDTKLPDWAKFKLADFTTEKFRNKIENRHSIHFAVSVTHEIGVVKCVKSVIQTLPHGGVAFIIDFNQAGWGLIRQTIHLETKIAREHFAEDQARLAQSRLDQDAIIQHWWQDTVPKYLPGRMHLIPMSHVYLVVYQAL